MIECRDAQNRVVLSITDRLTRQMGEATITALTTGSIVVPDSGTGTIWYVFTPPTSAGAYGYWPNITVSGDTISWTWTTSGANAFAQAIGGTLRYGRY